MALLPFALAETDTPADTPTPVTLDVIDEWAIGGGLLYWANSCFAEEFPPPSTIKRRPQAGGPPRLLETTGDEGCLSYLNIAAGDDGVYYYDDAQNRLEFISVVAPSDPQPVVDLPDSQAPTVGSSLKIVGDYLYWPSFNAGKLFRVLRAGGVIQTVAEGLSTPLDLLVVGSTVYWTDNSGVHSIRIDCDALPCTSTAATFSSFSGGSTAIGLLYRSNRLNYTVAWVERTPTGPGSSDHAIRQRTCSFITICLNKATTFYAAASNWVLGPLVSDGSSYFWTERFFSQSTPDGKVRRKALSGGDPADIAVGQKGIDRRLAITGGNLYFAIGPSGTTSGVYQLPLNAAAITRDLAAGAWEVTQAIQNTANGAPLVAGKTTHVRFYASQLNGPSASVVEAKLHGSRNGVPLAGSPLAPLNGSRVLQPGGSFNRAQANDSWNFLLPAGWLDGTIVLRAEVDPRQAYTDPNRDNNSLTGTFTFQKQPPVCVWTVPVRTHTPRPSVNDPNFWEMVDRFKQRWPVAQVWIFRDTNPVEELQVCWKGPFPYPCYGPYELEDEWSIANGIADRDKVIASLWLRAQLSFNPDMCDDISAPVHFMGLVHPDANNGGAAGYASTISKQSWVQLPPHAPLPPTAGWNSVPEGSVMAQELAHNYGRKHVNCGNPDDIDGNYPYPPCQLDNAGAASYYGFDARTQTPIPPTGAADFMSYAGSRWVSDYTWRAILNAFAAQAGAADVSRSAAPQAGEMVFAAGFIDLANHRGELNHLLVLPTASLPPQALARARAPHSAEAVYTLRLLDAQGGLLHEETLTPLPLDDHFAESDPALFSATFAPPAGEVAQVQLLADGAVIDALITGVGQPFVVVQQPTAGAVIDADLVIEWTAGDPDPEDQLLFTVQYSYDGGGQWHTLVADFPGSPTGNNRLALADLGSLHASSGQTALIRVVGSDGYHTAIGTSGSFSVPNRAPDAAILSPTAGQRFAPGAPVPLRGAAIDAEEGGLSGAALAWAVNGSPAGSGEELTAAGLPPGNHTTVLTATDGANNAAAVSVSFAVETLSIPAATAPQLDGFCDDAGYAGGVALPLAPFPGGERATVVLLRTSSHLWACFTGLQKADGGPGTFAGLRVDGNNSRDGLAQTDDFGFFVGENGDVISVAGDGSGGFGSPGPVGVLAQVSSGGAGWAGELRIDAAALGGFEHLIGLAVGQYALAQASDGYSWPFSAVANAPVTWAESALGALPSLNELNPITATVNSPAFALQLTGTNFVSGTVALWNGVELPTEFQDSEHLTATVGAAQLSSAGSFTVTTRGPEPGNFLSGGLPFVVEALPPHISQLNPASLLAGSPSITLTVSGANFSPDAQVLWNGEPLPTTFVNSGRLTARVDSAYLFDGQTVGVAVRNPTPQPVLSALASFEVLPAHILYLPAVAR